eukprot:522746_1
MFVIQFVVLIVIVVVAFVQFVVVVVIAIIVFEMVSGSIGDTTIRYESLTTREKNDSTWLADNFRLNQLTDYQENLPNQQNSIRQHTKVLLVTISYHILTIVIELSTYFEI